MAAAILSSAIRFLSISTQAIRVGTSISKTPVLAKAGGVMNDMPATGCPQKYLLVDDHAGFRHTVRDFLPGDRVEVIECGDGAQAVEMFSRLQPDWTLMDIEMPGMDGLQAARSIRFQHSKARIIILTQHDSPELREQARAAGAIAYVLKDRLKDLPGIISSLLQDPAPNPNPDSTP
jgi:CheY-like chemotaxis protein